jgi:cytochrome c oxidase assembly protein subunit 15
MRKLLKPLSLITCIGMLIVLMMGVLVTNTGAGHGCGSDWPLCNGKFVPSYTLESLIEWNHRAVTGLEGILVAVTFFAVWRNTRRYDARLFVSAAAFFTVLQAVLGAMAVVWQQSSAVLALHFGFSLLAFASTYLLYRLFVEADPLADDPESDDPLGDAPESGDLLTDTPKSNDPHTAGHETAGIQASADAAGSPESLAKSPATHAARASGVAQAPGAARAPQAGGGTSANPLGMPGTPAFSGATRTLVWISVIFCYVVVYLGAYVKHTKSSGACEGWPLCNGQLIPAFTEGAGIVFAHRVAAVLLFIIIAVMYAVVRRSSGRPNMIRYAGYSLGFVALQIASGAVLTYAIGTEWFLYAAMLHILIIAGLFANLICLCASLYPGLRNEKRHHAL